MPRRCDSVGEPMLVKLPESGYEDTGEGGLAFFLVVKQKPNGSRRQTCLAGDIGFPEQDVVISPSWIDGFNLIDAGLLIGSTGKSLFDMEIGYFAPTFSDLTLEGKRLYRTIKRLYGEVAIVTLLDT